MRIGDLSFYLFMLLYLNHMHQFGHSSVSEFWELLGSCITKMESNEVKCIYPDVTLIYTWYVPNSFVLQEKLRRNPKNRPRQFAEERSFARC